MIKFLRRKLVLFPKFTGPLRAYFNYFFGEKEIKVLFKLVKNLNKDFYFFDIGANYGIYTFLIGKRAKKVFVFDPIEECINYIKKGFKHKDSEFLNKIVSIDNENREIKIPIVDNIKIFGRSSLNNTFQHYESRQLKSLSIDSFTNTKDLNKNNISIIKIDAEGHELSIIQGATKFLKNGKCILLIEIEKRHNQEFRDVFNNLVKLGFDIYIAEDNNLKKIDNINQGLEEMSTNINFFFKNF